MSKRAKYSTNRQWDRTRWEDSANDGHNYFLRNLKHELLDIFAGDLSVKGPLSEVEYPKDFDEVPGRHIEGEFDVLMYDNDKITVYEVKNGGLKTVEKAVSQYVKARNFAHSFDRDLDFNIVHGKDIFLEVREMLEGATDSLGLDSGKTVEESDIRPEIGDYGIRSLVKGGILAKPEWLQVGYRKSDRSPEKFDFGAMRDEGLVEEEGHIVVGTEKLVEAMEKAPDNENIYFLTPFYDNFYGVDEIDQMLANTSY